MKAVYPSLSRNLIEQALSEALALFSYWPKAGQQLLLQLCTHCLYNGIIQFGEKFYTQKKGIITGDNNSVSLANISLHYVIKQIPQINIYTELFLRYIDDIIFITKLNTNSNFIHKLLNETFEKMT